MTDADYSQEQRMFGTAWRNIPADDVRFNQEGDLCVSTHVEMTDWLVREQRKTVVMYQSRLYYVSAAFNQAGICTYVLKRWRSGAEICGKTITYDDDYIRRRNQLAQRSQRAKGMRVVWPVLSLFLGFLWKESRGWVEEQVGVHSYAATQISIALEGVAIAIASVLLCISIWVAAYYKVPLFLFKPPYLLLTIFVAGPDLVMRIHYLMENANNQYGFYEWLLNRHSK